MSSVSESQSARSMLLPRSNDVCDWLSNVTRRRDMQEKLYVTQRHSRSLSWNINTKICAIMSRKQYGSGGAIPSPSQSLYFLFLFFLIVNQII